ncbi:hypothetical protein Patl1_10096 [Pistacia atlantica]|uniref:Uncharacterized protein n=1 Tax=Pistacia atlantica TaxID=434234 RepID=A0ACC1A4Y7_9ROSI|nr:hypothetical protein Patl1_10096 [Pistacia atlantica]
MVTGERQAARIGGLYLKTILRQDIAFFDAETSIGEVIGRMSGDTILIQDAMGEKVIGLDIAEYPGRLEGQIFSGSSLHVPSGTTAALVGQSGSGKSKVISLMERFYDPNSGEVLIDRVDLRELSLGWIREKIGLVSQEPILFATSIKENIAYGKENATNQEIRTALELANAAEFID